MRPLDSYGHPISRFGQALKRNWVWSQIVQAKSQGSHAVSFLLLRIQGESTLRAYNYVGMEEHLVPFVREIVPFLDPETREVLITPPEGMGLRFRIHN